MVRSASRKKGNTVTVDFTGVEAGNVKLIEGNYRFKVIEGQHKKDLGDEGAIGVKVEVIDGDSKKMVGKKITTMFFLGETSLWVLRNFLDAVGVEIPDGPLDIDLDELVDLEFEAAAYDDTYNDITRTKLRDYTPADGESTPAKDDDDDVKVTDRKKGKKEEVEEVTYTEEEIADMDEKGLKALVKEHDLDVDLADYANLRKKISAVIDALETAGMIGEAEKAPAKKSSKKEEPEEEEETAPKKGSKKPAPKEPAYTEDDVRDLDEKGLAALVKKEKLDLDLEDFASLRKKAMAVVDALETEGLLEAA